MIGIFDSGVGGLTVVRHIIKLLPHNKIIYFGDTARVPYGNKSKDNIVKYSIENTDFLISKGAKVIVIACHTASALASKVLKKRYPRMPIFDVIDSGLNKALLVTKNGRIGVIGTEATINSGAHQAYLYHRNHKIKVFNKACPLFVPLVEENWINKKETLSIAKHYLSYFKNKNIDTLVLACTHYPILKVIIAKIMGKNISIVDPSLETARQLKKYIYKQNKQNIKNRFQNEFYASDLPNKFGHMGAKLIGEKIKVKKI